MQRPRCQGKQRLLSTYDQIVSCQCKMFARGIHPERLFARRRVHQFHRTGEIPSRSFSNTQGDRIYRMIFLFICINIYDKEDYGVEDLRNELRLFGTVELVRLRTVTYTELSDLEMVRNLTGTTNCHAIQVAWHHAETLEEALTI